MKKILSVILTLFFLLFFVYYLLFFRTFNIAYDFESNKGFLKWLFDDPVSLVLGLTPGTKLHSARLNYDPSQDNTVFDVGVEETFPSSTPDTDDTIDDGTLVISAAPTLPEYLSFSDSTQVYNDFYSRMMSAQALSEDQQLSDEWNWETSMVSGNVVAKDSQKGMLGLDVIFPYYLVNQGNPHIFKIGCTVETSVLISSINLEALEYDIDFFEKVGVGDIVYAYCTSSECIGLGRGCILVEVQSE